MEVEKIYRPLHTLSERDGEGEMEKEREREMFTHRLTD